MSISYLYSPNAASAKPLTTSEAIEGLKTALLPEYGEGEAGSISRIVAEDVLGWRTGQAPRGLTSDQVEALTDVQRRLLAGEPLQYVTGRADFFGMKFKVDPRVLIPRAETEELVACAIQTIVRADETGKGIRVLDIGTGSGCIAVSLKKKLPGLRVDALDISAEALALAEENAAANGVSIGLIEMDILDEGTWDILQSYDLIVSNPPYVDWSEKAVMPRHVLDYEPHHALFVNGADNLLFYKKIMGLAWKKLTARGWLMLECSEYTAEKVYKRGRLSGFARGELLRDLQGKWRIWKGQLD
jgi:release factor glutamine methyltransferase